ncbi:MAG: endonuclease domain-containing protein [Patescibacteria group bacterium]
MQTHLKDFQRELRQNMTMPERVLWRAIRNEQLGVKFRRQFVIENFILDFYAPITKLGIEVDGESHFENLENQNKDKLRDEILFRQGIKVLRFLNTDITRNLEGVLMVVADEIKKKIT